MCIRDRATHEKISRYTISSKDVYISIAGTIGQVGAIPDSIDEMCIRERWHTALHKAEGSLADVKISVEDMISPKNVMDIFQFFTMFATDKKYQMCIRDSYIRLHQKIPRFSLIRSCAGKAQ